MSVDLVTGGAGFIGSHLVARLISAGHTVRVVDDLSTGKSDRLAPFAGRLEFVRGDLCDMELAPLFRDVRAVFHLAAIPSVTRSVRDPLATHHGTLTATLRLLVAAREARVERFVFSSSSSVYGETEQLPKHEELPVAPVSPYGVAKAAGEAYMRVFARLYGLHTVSLRYFNVFGPSQDPSSEYAAVIPIFVTRALAGEPLPVYGDGRQTRDFTYVENVVEANLAAVEANAVPGSVYNVAAGEPRSILDLVAELEGILDRSLEPRFLAPRPGDIHDSYADGRRAREHLGWSPRVSFREGLGRTVEWYQRLLVA